MTDKTDIITFDQDKYEKTTTSPDKPILHIDKVIFNSSDKDWVSRLFIASLTFKITCFDSHDQELKIYQDLMTLVPFITPQHRQPVLNINKLVTFREDHILHKDDKCHHWTISIKINNLTLQEDETLDIYLLDTNHIKEKHQHYQNRINDWKKRISNLYTTIQNWLQDNTEYKLTIGRPIQMYEGPMETYGIPPQQIDTADLFKSNKLLLTFKPKGLWVMGANGRVDIISAKGSYTLVDYAEPFAPPEWHLYTNRNRRKGAPFNKQALFSIL